MGNWLNFRFCIFGLALTVWVAGCARWNEPKLKNVDVNFPKTRMAIDAVGLEVGVAQLDTDQAETFETFWNSLDQQELPLELRKLLDQNGLRVAIMSPQPPATLQDLVDPKPIKVDELTDFEKQLHANELLKPAPRMITHDLISNREGQSHPVAVGETQAEASWIVRNGDKQTPGAEKSVHGVIAVTTYPQGDGSVRLIVRPELHHGESRSRIGAGENSFLMESAQAVTPIHDLQFSVTLRSGESLVVAPTRDVAELGKLFFGSSMPQELDSPKALPMHRMMLVRVVQTQMDDLFSRSNLGEKLTTVPYR